MAGARTALITGAGTGIGAATARRLAADGYAVALVGRRPGPLEQTARAIEATGGRAVVLPADAGDPAQAERAVAGAVEALGSLDVAVVAHGIGGSAAVGDDTPERWDDVLRVNLTGAFLVARAALPHLVERRGSIVTVASINAWVAGPGWASYCASKAGLAMLTASIANDYGPQGVRANCVCPGWVRTPMADEDMDEFASEWNTDRDGAYRLTTSSTPLRRPAEPDEIASVVAFLAGPGASYVNGAAIPVDGGAMVVDGTAVPFQGPGPGVAARGVRP
ncbi:MAG TPA: SDR family NAD(P)-dependent oxidoreductase [Gaiellales bacterium]|nr:SDR family NAD(P)-dependent oxidoreductase [Gaiellales bacterium]